MHLISNSHTCILIDTSQTHTHTHTYTHIHTHTHTHTHVGKGIDNDMHEWMNDAHAVTNHLKNAAQGPGVDSRLVAGAFHAEGLTCRYVHVSMCTYARHVQGGVGVFVRVYVYTCAHTHALLDIHTQK